MLAGETFKVTLPDILSTLCDKDDDRLHDHADDDVDSEFVDDIDNCSQLEAILNNPNDFIFLKFSIHYLNIIRDMSLITIETVY